MSKRHVLPHPPLHSLNLQQHEQRTDLTYTRLTLILTWQSNDYSLSLPYLGGGVGEILCLHCLPHPHLFARGGAGGVAGWVLPCPSSLLNVRVEAGGKGQPLRMPKLTYLTS
jgi:hypothetical protein